LIGPTDAATLKWNDYSFLPDYRGSPVDSFAYIVLTIEAADSRPNWKQISAIRDAERALNDAVKGAGRKIADPNSEGCGKAENTLLGVPVGVHELMRAGWPTRGRFGTRQNRQLHQARGRWVGSGRD
jgi:hypothetical protein